MNAQPSSHKLRLKKFRQHRKAARVLYRNQLYGDCVSRAYYAAFSFRLFGSYHQSPTPTSWWKSSPPMPIHKTIRTSLLPFKATWSGNTTSHLELSRCQNVKPQRRGYLTSRQSRAVSYFLQRATDNRHLTKLREAPGKEFIERAELAERVNHPTFHAAIDVDRLAGDESRALL